MAGLTICSSCLSKSVYESTINHALICDTSQRCAVITGTGDLVNRGVAYTDFRARPRVRLFCYVFRMNESDCDCSQLATYTTWSNMAQHILETVRFLTHRPWFNYCVSAEMGFQFPRNMVITVLPLCDIAHWDLLYQPVRTHMSWILSIILYKKSELLKELIGLHLGPGY